MLAIGGISVSQLWGHLRKLSQEVSITVALAAQHLQYILKEGVLLQPLAQRDAPGIALEQVV